jgi:hypothetical protein
MHCSTSCTLLSQTALHHDIKSLIRTGPGDAPITVMETWEGESNIGIYIESEEETRNTNNPELIIANFSLVT